jgi:alpha-ketoglutarate-dependent taurine dioxygenase
VDHPIVRRHAESGRACLFLGGRRHASIVGLPPEESAAILDQLWAEAAKERFTWTQVWRAGDLVCWDNRCAMHKRDAFDPAATRLMHRTTAEGERPIMACVE